MDLSIQKMQPPASVQGKSAAKKSSKSQEEKDDDAVEAAERDQETRFMHGNTAYTTVDPDEQQSDTEQESDYRNRRRKQRQMISGEDLSQLTQAHEETQAQSQLAGERLNMRAYAALPENSDDEIEHQFDRNI